MPKFVTGDSRQLDRELRIASDSLNPREVSEAIDAERRYRRDLEAEVERLKETLRTVSCAVPAEWGNARGHKKRAYDALSAFLIEDQRR